MNINDCYNFEDFRKLAKKKLPSPIFHYIDGGADAKNAVEIGCTGIMVSNHGGIQLDGAISPFYQLAAIVAAVGEKL